MNNIKTKISRLIKNFHRYRDNMQDKFEKLCKNVKMSPPLTRDDHDLIELLLPFFDSQAEYCGDNSIEGLYEFHQVSNESDIHSMLCMLNHPDYEWVCSDDCDRSTNGAIVALTLEKRE